MAEVRALEFESTLIVAWRDRIQLLERCESDVSNQALVLAMCKRDLLYWVTRFAVTYDPRLKVKRIPFVPFQRQKEYLHWRQERFEAREIGVCEKARDAGITWLNVAHQTWCWLFLDGFAGGFGSRKLDLVDRIGDPDCIFEKIRFLLRNLPPWMMPSQFDWKKHDNYCKIINPNTGSTITGEGGDDIGRGARKSIYDVDEAAFLEHPMAVDAALSNTTDVVIYTSSANGPSGPFFDKRNNLPQRQIFRLEWKTDPRKNYWVVESPEGGTLQRGQGYDAPPGAIYPWYEKQKARLHPVILASEVDIDYSASVENVVIPGQYVQPAIASPFFHETGIITAALDVADEGGDDNVLLIRNGSRVTDIYGWKEGTPTQTAYKTLFLCIKHGVHRLIYDDNGVGAGVRGVLQALSDAPRGELHKYPDEVSDRVLRDMDRANWKVPFEFIGFPAGSAPQEGRSWPEFADRDSRDIFKNVRAETMWLLRKRFERVYEIRQNVATYHPDDLVSIPHHALLIGQISMPTYSFTATGLIVIQSKTKMKKSPDYLDALMMSFYEPPPDPRKTRGRWMNNI